MSGIDVITKFDTKFRKILSRDFGAGDDCLTEQIQQLKSRLPVNLMKQLLKIDAICRKVLQNPEQTHTHDLTNFVNICLEAEQELENFRQEEVRREEERRKKEETAQRREKERRAEEQRKREREEAHRRMVEAKAARRQEQLRQEREKYQESLETSRIQREKRDQSQLEEAKRMHDARRRRWAATKSTDADTQRQQRRVDELLAQAPQDVYRRLLSEDPLSTDTLLCQCWHCGHRFQQTARPARRLVCPACQAPCPSPDEAAATGG